MAHTPRDVLTLRRPAAAGTLVRDFKHLAVDLYLTEEEGQKTLQVDCHFSKRKRVASLRTAVSHVNVSLLLGLVGRRDMLCPACRSKSGSVSRQPQREGGSPPPMPLTRQQQCYLHPVGKRSSFDKGRVVCAWCTFKRLLL